MEGLLMTDLLYRGLLLGAFFDDVSHIACAEGLADAFQLAVHDMEELFFQWIAVCLGRQHGSFATCEKIRTGRSGVRQNARRSVDASAWEGTLVVSAPSPSVEWGRCTARAFPTESPNIPPVCP